MTEELRKKAEKYASKEGHSESEDAHFAHKREIAIKAFIAGYDSRQSEIDELVKAVKEQTEWISVDDRLPEVDKKRGISKDVLIDTGIYKVAAYCKGRHYPNGAWFCSSEGHQSYPKYWRPICEASELLKKYEK